MSTALKREMLQPDAGDERQSLGYVGMVIFLGSWAMMFGALFFAYGVLRVRVSMWPPLGEEPLPLLLPGLSTLVLAASSIAMHLGLAALRGSRIDRFRQWITATLLLGTLFLAVQCLVWSVVWDTGLRPGSSPYGSMFYVFTAFHFLHVVVGLGILLWILVPSIGQNARAPRRLPVKLTSMYWHFVDVVWVLIYVSLYLV